MWRKQAKNTLAGACAAALVMTMAAQAAPAAGVAVPGTDGKWFLVRDDEEPYCLVVAKNRTGALIGFVVVGEYIGLSLYDDVWNLPDGAKYSVSLRFDGKRSYTLQMQASSESVMAAEVFDVGVREFSHSSTVAIYNEGGALVDTYSLKGSRLALDYVRRCGRIAANLQTPPRFNPFAQQPASRSNPFD